MLRTLAVTAVTTIATLIASLGDVRAVEPGARALAAHSRSTTARYIVRMRASPVLTYKGELAGYTATRPAADSRLDADDPNVRRYAALLESRHDDALRRAGGRKLYSYKYSFNGFAAELTEQQVAELKATPGVVHIEREELHKPDTTTTPAFLRLTGRDGAWRKLGGVDEAGEDIVIGMIDTGVWPESLSFSDRFRAEEQGGGDDDEDDDGDDDEERQYDRLKGWKGACEVGEQFTRKHCNNKLIAAQFFSEGAAAALEGLGGIKAAFPYEYLSPRDADGHGTHTASTAGGNFGVPLEINGIPLGRSSGMAPRARLSIYKACWGRDEDVAGCYTTDTVAAIEQAIVDGVDVINYSIGGSTSSIVNAVETAFFNAAEAGIFVATSAGNSGPTASTVAHNGPWVTTVAAGTHDRLIAGTATLGNGAAHVGASLHPVDTPSKLVVLSTAAGVAVDPDPMNATPFAQRVLLCFGGHLDPAKVSGKLVVCDRGITDRVAKSAEVARAGGHAMILVNPTANTLNADFHSVPTVHVDHVAGPAIKAYVNANVGTATASLSKGVITNSALASDVAAFSSRGPAIAGAGDLLKPDIMAPGVDVLASYSPANGQQDFNSLQGTSMSSPHIAGLAALVRQEHPKWSPARIKSALMTSTTLLRNDGSTIPGNAFGFGAGFVQPLKALDPGLVYEHGPNDWIEYLCGIRQLACVSSVDPSDLNYPSISIGALAGTQTVKRRVTNVDDRSSTYVANVSAPPGTTVTVSPTSLRLKPKQTREYTVTIARTTAALNAYTFGALTWSDGRHEVRSPITVRPVALAAPAQVTGNGGPLSYPVTFGYDGTFTATARGLVPAATTDSNVVDDPGNSFVRGGPGTVSFPLTLPVGTTYARIALFDEHTDGNDDLDLYVYLGDSLVGASGGATSLEEVNFAFASPRTTPLSLVVWVHGFQTDGPDANFRLFTWTLGTAAAGNMTVTAPTTAVTGTTANIGLTFSSLSAGTKYLGSVAYSGAPGLPLPTIVRIDTP